MKRRDFLKMTAAASAGIAVAGTPISAMGRDSVFGKWLNGRATNGNVMVFVLMAGGNDGLNTLIPLDKYTELSNARPNLLIPANDVLTLTGNPLTGLHPSMTGMQSLFNNGKMNIIQGVSYPNNNYSHFRATDIYMSGKDASINSTTGWLGRSLDNQLPGAPQAYPNASFSDPLAIEIGSSASLFLAGNAGTNGMSISSINSFYNIVNSTVDPAPNTKAGNELTFLRYISQQTNAYNQVIQQAANLGNNLATYPANNRLADQLKIVANLISGGLQTPFYIVRQGGYDTHFNQVDSNDPKVGNHANLLDDLSSAITAFQTDLQMLGKDNNVAGMTISEFGRRIIENASVGSDHGKAGPVFVFGKNVNPNILGSNPVLPTNATVSDQVPMQHDFKDIYASVLHDWMGMTDADTKAVLNPNVVVQPVFCPNSSLVTLNNPCFSSALPVESYTYFTVSPDGCTNELSWGTRNEEEVVRFEIERGTDGTNFEKIGEVLALNQQENNYRFDDRELENEVETYYYRFKAVDVNDNFAYSFVRSAINQCNIQEFTVSVYPNPADDRLQLIVNTHTEMNVELEIFSMQGRSVHTERLIVQAGRAIKSFNISSLPSGMYVLTVVDKDNKNKLADLKFAKN